ncbi:MAG: hypothetical protein R3A11_03855 [Bdellovibrionota bacterium]
MKTTFWLIAAALILSSNAALAQKNMDLESGFEIPTHKTEANAVETITIATVVSCDSYILPDSNKNVSDISKLIAQNNVIIDQHLWNELAAREHDLLDQGKIEDLTQGAATILVRHPESSQHPHDFYAYQIDQNRANTVYIYKQECEYDYKTIAVAPTEPANSRDHIEYSGKQDH